ncbi:SIR2 family protein [Enterococcus xiangfangensis]|uniref:SIR2 family protein n=1 Tax=Enterococcus xiangfangensis TaxID=1296537 RepID=UPI003D169D8A|nr:hypothetical protein [Enterococcus asini]
MLNDIVKENRYPIIFIGSGISKRYLKNFPNWEELLKEYWDKIGETQNFYSYLRSLKQDESLSQKKNSEKDFYANTIAATYIQGKFDDLFFSEEIVIESLSIKDAYQTKLSPFKYDIAERFKNYEIRDGVEEELEMFKVFLSKAKMIITTNYDTFIEDLLEDIDAKPNVYVGQKGFFDQTLDWSELYKIHGDVNTSNSIVINEQDYLEYDHNSVLLSAKILVNMIESPIIFLGYSLSDRNVRELLGEFSSQIPQEDIRKTTNRIIIVEYEKDKSFLEEEMMRDQELDINYLHILTDNFTLLFNQISKINEGLSPKEVLRYQKAIKNIIVSAGSKGRLDTVLVSPQQMENLEEQISDGKNIVVALGDRKNVFVFPDIISYMHDYLFELNEYLPETALSFAAQDGSRITKTPFLRYLAENDVKSLNLKSEVIEKLNNKIEQTSNFEEFKKDLNGYFKLDFDNLSSIIDQNFNFNRECGIVAYNMDKLDIQEVQKYIQETSYPQFVSSVKNKTNLRSSVRKVFFAYDFIKYGAPKKI